ncbi:hypothetical protein E4T48_00378 [Aureobasidium sp. EXF-10727]|nr:hypothetical protein E4T48_00378 [Aureobasidium sp. EXF-10727]KAI4729812.1 hypothetical protein E4T49_02431 [Aureobasidium sp. EXF-10728]
MILKALFVIFSLTLPICMTTPVPPCKIAPLTSAEILTIAPESVSCTEAAYPAECATATHATPYINAAFTSFSIHDFGTQAALLALMIYESEAFRYSINHYPGVPGQGTRNMQSPAFNLRYAYWLAANMNESGISVRQVQEAEAEGVVQVLELVNGDCWGFASAAWFLVTQCEGEIRKGLAGLTEEGWNAYLTDCVGTTVTDERTAIWKKAVALGKW